MSVKSDDSNDKGFEVARFFKEQSQKDRVGHDYIEVKAKQRKEHKIAKSVAKLQKQQRFYEQERKTALAREEVRQSGYKEAILKAGEASDFLKAFDFSVGDFAVFSFKAWDEPLAMINIAELALAGFANKETPLTREVAKNPESIRRGLTNAPFPTKNPFWYYFPEDVHESQDSRKKLGTLYSLDFERTLGDFEAKLLITKGNRNVTSTAMILLAPNNRNVDFEILAMDLAKIQHQEDQQVTA